MSGLASRQSSVPIAALALWLAISLLSGCAGSTETPNSATTATAVPGSAPTLGAASQGDLSMSGLSIHRLGTRLIISAQIHNAGSTSDELLQIGSQLSPTLTLAQPLEVPAGGTVPLGSGSVLEQQGRLEPGGTVDLMLQFRRAGLLQVFSSFH